MKVSKNNKEFEQFVEKNVIQPEGNGTESGNFGDNSFEAQKILGQTLQKQRKIRLSNTSTVIWGIFIIVLIAGVVSIFIFK